MLELEDRLRLLENSIGVANLVNGSASLQDKSPTQQAADSHLNTFSGRNASPIQPLHTEDIVPSLQIPPTSSEQGTDIVPGPGPLLENPPLHSSHHNLLESVPNLSDQQQALLTIPTQPEGLVQTADTWHLLQEYISDFQKDVPIFDAIALIEAFRQTDMGEEIDKKSRTMLNVAMAIAYSHRDVSTFTDLGDGVQAKQYFIRAMSDLPVMFTSSSLLNARCLLGLAVYLEYSKGCQEALPILTASIRMLQNIRLDMQKVKLESELDQVDKLLGISLVMEANTCLVSSIRPSLALGDIYAAGMSPRSGASGDNFEPASILQLHVRLADIQARIATKLLAPPSRSRAPGAVRRMLEKERSDFKDWQNIAVAVAGPESTNLNLRPSEIMRFITLESRAFRTLWSLSGIKHIEHVQPIPAAFDEMNDKIIECGEGLYHGAKSLLHVLMLGPESGACLGLAADAIASAICVVLAYGNLQRDGDSEQDTRQHADVALMRLRALAKSRPNSRINAVCDLATIGKLCSTMSAAG